MPRKPATPRNRAKAPKTQAKPKTAPRGDEATRFQPGNKFWLARSSHGKRPYFSDGESLWSACCEYFEWADANPLYEDRLVVFQGSAAHEPVAKMRAMTLRGLYAFLDIHHTTWLHWRNERPELADTIDRVESVIYQQKFAGAAADLLNATIIGRELGLSEKSEVRASVTVSHEDALDALE